MKNKVVILFMVVMILGIFVGCSNSGDSKQASSGDNNEASSNNSDENSSEKKTIIRLATWDDAEGAKNTQKLIDEFEAEHPNVEVQFEPTSKDYMTKLRTSIAAGNTPDVMMVDEWTTLYPVQPFEPLDGWFESEGFDSSIYDPEVLKLWNDNGKQYGLPADINLIGFFYNKELFDNAGIAYPNSEWTYDDLTQMAEKLTVGEGTEKTYGIFIPSNWIGAIEPMLWGKGGQLINDNLEYEGVMNSDATVKAIEWYTSFEKKGYSPKSSTSQAMGGSEEMFKTGKIAMMLSGHWTLQSLKSSEGFDIDKLGTVELPKGENGIKPSVIFSAGWHISKDSEHKELAFALLTKMAGREAQKMKSEAGWSLPAIPELTSELGFEDDELRTPFLNMAYGDEYTKNKFSIYYSPVGSSIDENLSLAVQKVILDASDAKSALDEAVQNIKSME